MENINLPYLSDRVVDILFLGFAGFLFAMLITPIYTTVAYRYKFWKKPRNVAVTGEKATLFSKLHRKKHARNIPTMAGVIFLAAIFIVTVLFNLDREQTWLPLTATLGAGLVGLLDDIINIKGLGGGIAGLNSKLKFGLIFAVSAIGAWYFYDKLGHNSFHLTFYGNIEVGVLLIPLFILVVISTANAVNISDGLDGLAGGLLASAYSAYALIALLQGSYGIAGFCMSVVGILLSYIWFNIYPARFFMGDVGSFALGTALGVVAMLTDTLVLLPVIGLVFVVEAGSSLLQVLSKKILGRKVFKLAPIHHHFEALGWPETKVTMRFWVVGQVMAVMGMILALVGGHIAT